jgi:ribosomal 30S subunit maturation factor RimM
MIPYVNDFIKEINLNDKKIVINNIKGLIEWQ